MVEVLDTGVSATPAATQRWSLRALLPGKRRRTRRDLLDTLGVFAARLAVLGILIGAWQLTVTWKLADPTVTSRPADVFTYLYHALGGSLLWTNLWATLKAALIAFVLASIAGIIIGIALALLPWFEKVINPYLSAMNATPRIALAPVFVVAFGLSIQAKVALAITIVVFILITSARAGVRSVDIEHMRLATMLGANKLQMFFKILLPVAIPSIFGGLRLGVIYALLGTLTAELLGSTDGMGQLLQQAAGVFRTDQIYGLIIVLAVTATLINSLMGILERHLLRWQTPPQ